MLYCDFRSIVWNLSRKFYLPLTDTDRVSIAEYLGKNNSVGIGGTLLMIDTIDECVSDSNPSGRAIFGFSDQDYLLAESVNLTELACAVDWAVSECEDLDCDHWDDGSYRGEYGYPEIG